MDSGERMDRMREREEGEGEETRTRVGTVDKCTCIPSYCISSNYPPRSHNDRDKVRGKREKRSRIARRNYFTRSCNIYIASEAREEEVGIEAQRKGRA